MAIVSANLHPGAKIHSGAKVPTDANVTHENGSICLFELLLSIPDNSYDHVRTVRPFCGT